MAEEKLIAASTSGGGPAGGGDGDGDAAADPVSAAVIQSLDAKLESIDDLIARLEIEEGEVRANVCLPRVVKHQDRSGGGGAVNVGVRSAILSVFNFSFTAPSVKTCVFLCNQCGFRRLANVCVTERVQVKK